MRIECGFTCNSQCTNTCLRETATVTIWFRDQQPLNKLNIFQSSIEKWQEEIEEMTINDIQLKKTYLEIMEMHYVLRSIGSILGDDNERQLVQ